MYVANWSGGLSNVTTAVRLNDEDQQGITHNIQWEQLKKEIENNGREVLMYVTGTGVSTPNNFRQYYKVTAISTATGYAILTVSDEEDASNTWGAESMYTISFDIMGIPTSNLGPKESFIPNNPGGPFTLDTNYYLGNYYNMTTVFTTSGANFTTTGATPITLGGFARIRINLSTQPTVTGATLIEGDFFSPNVDMYLTAQYNGNITEYWFELI